MHTKFTLENMGISPEHVAKFKKVDAELKELANRATHQFDKEKIEHLANLTPDQIQNFDKEQAVAYYSDFYHLNELVTKTWEYFTLSEPKPTDTRILEIIQNHVSKDIMGQLKTIEELTQRGGFFGVVDKKIFPEMEQTIKWATTYMNFHQHKTQLEANNQLIFKHTAELAEIPVSCFLQ